MVLKTPCFVVATEKCLTNLRYPVCCLSASRQFVLQAHLRVLRTTLELLLLGRVPKFQVRAPSQQLRCGAVAQADSNSLSTRPESIFDPIAFIRPPSFTFRDVRSVLASSLGHCADDLVLMDLDALLELDLPIGDAAAAAASSSIDEFVRKDFARVKVQVRSAAGMARLVMWLNWNSLVP